MGRRAERRRVTGRLAGVRMGRRHSLDTWIDRCSHLAGPRTVLWPASCAGSFWLGHRHVHFCVGGRASLVHARHSRLERGFLDRVRCRGGVLSPTAANRSRRAAPQIGDPGAMGWPGRRRSVLCRPDGFLRLRCTPRAPEWHRGAFARLVFHGVQSLGRGRVARMGVRPRPPSADTSAVPASRCGNLDACVVAFCCRLLGRPPVLGDCAQSPICSHTRYFCEAQPHGRRAVDACRRADRCGVGPPHPWSRAQCVGRRLVCRGGGRLDACAGVHAEPRLDRSAGGRRCLDMMWINQDISVGCMDRHASSSASRFPGRWAPPETA